MSKSAIMSCDMSNKTDLYPSTVPYKHASSRIWTWDLSICLYLNLKHGNLDQSATVLEAECSKLTKLRNNTCWMINKMNDSSYFIEQQI